jgi:hypothetical protein
VVRAKRCSVAHIAVLALIAAPVISKTVGRGSLSLHVPSGTQTTRWLGAMCVPDVWRRVHLATCSADTLVADARVRSEFPLPVREVRCLWLASEDFPDASPRAPVRGCSRRRSERARVLVTAFELGIWTDSRVACSELVAARAVSHDP